MRAIERRRRRGRQRGRLPQIRAPAGAGEDVWAVLPEVNRQVAVRWLAELAGRSLAGDAPGSSGEGASA